MTNCPNKLKIYRDYNLLTQPHRHIDHCYDGPMMCDWRRDETQSALVKAIYSLLLFILCPSYKNKSINFRLLLQIVCVSIWNFSYSLSPSLSLNLNKSKRKLIWAMLKRSFQHLALCDVIDLMCRLSGQEKKKKLPLSHACEAFCRSICVIVELNLTAKCPEIRLFDQIKSK